MSSTSSVTCTFVAALDVNSDGRRSVAPSRRCERHCHRRCWFVTIACVTRSHFVMSLAAEVDERHADRQTDCVSAARSLSWWTARYCSRRGLTVDAIAHCRLSKSSIVEARRLQVCASPRLARCVSTLNTGGSCSCSTYNLSQCQSL